MAKAKQVVVKKETPILNLNPNQIKILEGERGRYMRPNDATIVELALSLYQDGQKQPIRVRKDKDVYYCTAGFTRLEAAQLIQNGFESDDGNFKDENFCIMAIEESSNNPVDWAISNVVENAQRNELSPIDISYNIKKLELLGLKSTQIARIFGQNDGYVSRFKRLINLEDSIQLQVHLGEIPYTAVIDLADLPVEQQLEIIKASMTDKGINANKLKQNSKEQKKEQQEKVQKEGGKRGRGRPVGSAKTLENKNPVPTGGNKTVSVSVTKNDDSPPSEEEKKDDGPVIDYARKCAKLHQEILKKMSECNDNKISNNFTMLLNDFDAYLNDEIILRDLMKCLEDYTTNSQS